MAGVTSRVERLSVYLAQAAKTPFDHAKGWDCAAGLVARWIEQETGVDPAKSWRGRYVTAAGAAVLVASEGGLEALMDRGTREAGLAPTCKPKAGDVGVVLQNTPYGPQPVAAIRTRRRWAVLTATGLRSSSRARCLAAWSLPA